MYRVVLVLCDGFRGNCWKTSHIVLSLHSYNYIYIPPEIMRANFSKNITRITFVLKLTVDLHTYETTVPYRMRNLNMGTISITAAWYGRVYKYISHQLNIYKINKHQFTYDLRLTIRDQ